MSMREYGIRGFGLCFDDVSNYFNRKRAIEWLAEHYGDVVEEEECDGRMNSQIIEEILLISFFISSIKLLILPSFPPFLL